MSLCINPQCLQPDHPDNFRSETCQSCGAPLLLQGRYRVMRQISSTTGFGTVYEAYERNHPRILKVLRRDRAQQDKVLEMFRHEAKVLGQIHHPGVPYVAEDSYFTLALPGVTDPLHCIVMEKIEGLNLRQWMQQQGNHPIPEAQALQWLIQLTDILQRIHHQNFFHRDIKPDNVMVRANGQLVLVDFGAVREVTQTYLAHIASQGGITKISSAGYTPPEQEQGQAVPQSDFYALGRTIIYLLTALSPNDAAIYDPLRNCFDWRPHAPQVSEDFAQLLDSLVAPRVVDRPANAQSILDALQRLARDRWWNAKADTGGISTLLPDTTLTPNTTAGANASTTSPLPNPDPPPHPPRPPHPSESSTVPVFTGIGTEGPEFFGPPGFTPQGPASQMPPPPVSIPANSIPAQQRSWLNRGGRGLLPLVAVGAIAVIGIGIGHQAGLFTPDSGEDTPALAVTPTPAQLRRTLSDHTSPVNTLALLSDGRRLLSGGADRGIRLWDVDTGAVLQTWPPTQSLINVLALSLDETLIYAAQADGTVEAWPLDLSGEETTPRWQQTVTPGTAINTLTPTPDGQQLVAGAADGTLYILATGDGATEQTIPAHQGAINTVAVTADGQGVISGGSDRAVRVWSLATGELQQTLGEHDSFVNHLVIHPDGQTVYSAGADGFIYQWHLATGELHHTLVGHDSYVNRLALSRDGQTLISGGADQTVWFWDIRTGAAQAQWTGFGLPVDELVLTPSQVLITASRTATTLQIWALEP